MSIEEQVLPETPTNDQLLAAISEATKERQEAITVDQEPQVAEVKAEEPKYSELELKAIAKGWIPKDKFHGDPDTYKGAKAFLKDGELFDSIKSSSKKIHELEKALESLLEHNKKVEKVSYDKAMADLRTQLIGAAEIGDVKTVSSVSEQLLQMQRPQPKEDDIESAKREFLNRNRAWYNANSKENIELSSYAGNVSSMLKLEKPNMSITEHLAEVEAIVKRDFPAKFADPSKTEVVKQVSSVESATNTSGMIKSKKLRSDDLSSAEKQVLRQLKSSVKNFNEEEFLQHLQRSKDLGVN